MNEQIILEFSVTQTATIRLDDNVIASGTRNSVIARYTFLSYWNDIVTNAIFRKGGARYEVPIINGESIVPNQVLAEKGQFSVCVYGGDLRTTTTESYVAVRQSGYTMIDPDEPETPTRFFVRTVGTMITDIRINPVTNIFEISLDNTASWIPFPAYDGWTAIFGMASDGERRVLMVVDWVGGVADKPPVGVYVGANGFVTDIALGVDVRGAQGLQGIQGVQGDKGDKGDQGIQGIQGERGLQGIQGIQGIQGEKGDKGDQGDQGIQGEKGETGTAATIAVNATTTGEPGTNAMVENVGTTSAALLNFTIPKGEKGESLTPIGHFNTLADLEVAVPNPDVGVSYSVGFFIPYDIYVFGFDSNTGTNRWINQGPIQGPKGDTGLAATIGVRTTTTGAPGTNASVTNAGTAYNALLDFVIPRGDKGEKGDQGIQGEPGSNEAIAPLTLFFSGTNSMSSTRPGENVTIPIAGVGSAMVYRSFNYTLTQNERAVPNARRDVLLWLSGLSSGRDYNVSVNLYHTSEVANNHIAGGASMFTATTTTQNVLAVLNVPYISEIIQLLSGTPVIVKVGLSRTGAGTQTVNIVTDVANNRFSTYEREGAVDTPAPNVRDFWRGNDYSQAEINDVLGAESSGFVTALSNHATNQNPTEQHMAKVGSDFLLPDGDKVWDSGNLPYPLVYNTQILTNADLNDYKNQGEFYNGGNPVLHAPGNGVGFSLKVEKNYAWTDGITQTLKYHFGDWYTRVFYNGVWHEWMKIPMVGEYGKQIFTWGMPVLQNGFSVAADPNYYFHYAISSDGECEFSGLVKSPHIAQWGSVSPFSLPYAPFKPKLAKCMYYTYELQCVVYNFSGSVVITTPVEIPADTDIWISGNFFAT